LDKAEGLGKGYEEKNVSVGLPEDKSITAQVYVASHNSINDLVEPYDWYVDFIISGMRDYKFPPNYVQEIQSIQTKTDPDKKREQKQREILGRGMDN
jgi:hypothetical protein